MASINTISFDLRALIEFKKVGRFSPRKVWVPKYCMVCVDKLKNEWSAVCTNPPLGRTSVKGIQPGIEQHNKFSKEMRLSLKGKMNSPGYWFVPPREKVAERPTLPWDRFTANDAGRFRECSSRNKAFSIRGKFTPLNDKAIWKVTIPRKKANKPIFPREITEGRFPRGGFGDRVVPLSKRKFLLKDRITPPKGRLFPLREKIIGNFTSSREKVGEGHVLPVIPVFLGSGPSSPRYRMMSPRDKFTSSKDMVGNKPNFSRERVAKMERHVRRIIPPRVSPGQRWHVVQNTKFPQRFSRTQKRRMQRQRAMNKRHLIDVFDKTHLEETMELEKANEGMVPSLEKIKF